MCMKCQNTHLAEQLRGIDNKMTTKEYLAEVEHELKRLEIRSMLSNTKDKAGLDRSIKDKQRVAKTLRSMVGGKVEYR